MFLAILSGSSNTGPVITVPGAQSIYENENLTFSAGGGTAISVSDAEQSSLAITITVTNGTATLSQTTGLSFTTGDGTADALMEFSGDIDDINDALEGMIFTPSSVGAGSVAVEAEDGEGGTDNKSVSIDVEEVPLPTQSTEFTSASSQYVTMSDADFGGYDREKFTIHRSIKRKSTGGSQYIWTHAGASGNYAIFILFDPNNKISIATYQNGTAEAGRLVTTAAYTNTSDFYDITIHYDSANATANDRIRLEVDGSAVTSFTSRTNPTAAIFDTTANASIGYNGQASPAGYANVIDYNFRFYSGVNPSQADILAGSTAGLWSSRPVTGGDVTFDGARGASWTNVNAATASSTIPT